MFTVDHDSQRDFVKPRLCHSNLIYVGKRTDTLRNLVLKAWQQRHPIQRLQCYVLDVSAHGSLKKVVAEAALSGELGTDIKVWHSVEDDAAICKALKQFLADCDPGVRPNQVILDLHQKDFPETAATCREFATKWFYGKGPDKMQRDWAFDSLLSLKARAAFETLSAEWTQHDAIKPAYEAIADALKISLDHLRMCVIKRRYPRRPSALLIAAPRLRDSLALQLTSLSDSWLSFIQMVDGSGVIDQLWECREAPDIIFSDKKSFELLRGRWTDCTWIVALEENEDSKGSILGENLRNVEFRATLPETLVAWTTEPVNSVVPIWVTRPLNRNDHTLPAIEDYQPIPEFNQVLELWRDGSPRVVCLTGYGGSGKTALLRHFLDECITVSEDYQRNQPQHESLPMADAIFVWDFYAEPFSEKFLQSLADYFAPESAGSSGSEAYLHRIHLGLNRNNLRRVVLVLDGLETIQTLRDGSVDEGYLQDSVVLKLLEEIAAGEFPITAFISSRLSLVELDGRFAEGCVQISVGKLTRRVARDLLRLGIGQASDESLDTLADRFGLHAMTLYHLGRLLGDFYQGDTLAADRLPVVEKILQPAGVQEVDEVNRHFIQLFARYEEHLSVQELAVLQRLAVVGEPLSVSEFAQIFTDSETESIAGPLAGMEPEEIQARFDVLHKRRLLNLHSVSARAHRYATHPTLSYYFAQALASDAESLSLGARDYYQRQLEKFSAPGLSSTHVGVHTHGAVRTRGAALGPNESQEYPTNTIILDLLERIIFHTVRSARLEEARLYYQRRMGGDKHLKAIGQQARAGRINAWLNKQRAS